MDDENNNLLLDKKEKKQNDIKLFKTKYKINIKNILGKGSFSKVYFAINEKKERFAIKVITLKKLDKSRLDKFRRELEISLDLDHKNIVKCYEIFESDIGWYIVNEYCNRGTFVDVIREFKEAKINANDFIGREILAHFYLSQLRDAIYYLHSKGIVHRDLKPANILISKIKDTNEEILKLADFGFARYFDFNSDKINEDDMTATICGSPIYMAPELILGGHYNIKADLWSFGIIMYELLYGKNPYNSPKSYRQLEIRMANEPIIFQDIYSEKCIDLIKNLLKIKTQDRIGWEDFFNHEWFLLKIEDLKQTEESNDERVLQSNKTNVVNCNIDDSIDNDVENDIINTKKSETELSDSSIARRELFKKFEESKQEDELLLKLRKKSKPSNLDETMNVQIKKNSNKLMKKEEMTLSEEELKPSQKKKNVLEKEEKLRYTFQLLNERGRTGSDIARDLEKSPFSSTGFDSELGKSSDLTNTFQDLLENSLDTYFGKDTKPNNESNDIINKIDHIKNNKKNKIKNCKMSVGESVIRILSDSIGYSFSYPRNYGSPL